MVAEGEDVNQVNESGHTALMWASYDNHLDIATVLLEHGADLNKADEFGFTPVSEACFRGHLAMVQLVSSYDPERIFTINGTILTVEEEATRMRHTALAAWLVSSRKWTAEERATFMGHPACAAWLVTSRKWTTPLHHLTIIPATRAHALLRNGASIHAAAAPGDPTPLSLTRELLAKCEAAKGSAAALVLSRWRPRLLALAMGTHTRLGAESPFRHLGGTHGLLETSAEMGS